MVEGLIGGKHYPAPSEHQCQAISVCVVLEGIAFRLQPGTQNIRWKSRAIDGVENE